MSTGEPPRNPPPGEGIFFENRLGAFVRALMETSISSGAASPRDTSRNDNPFYFVYLSNPIPGSERRPAAEATPREPWVGRIMIAGPYYHDHPGWAAVRDNYTELRLEEEVNVRGPRHTMVVVRQYVPEEAIDRAVPDTIMVWLPWA